MTDQTLTEETYINEDHLRKLLSLNDKRKTAIFLARGSAGNKWFQGAKGKWTLKDEYAENMPEALISLTRRIGWKLIVVFVGQEPVYDKHRKSYADRYKHVKVCSLGDIKFAMSRFKADIQPKFKALCEDLEESGTFTEMLSYRGIKFDQQNIESMLSDIPRLSSTYVGMTELWTHFFNFVKAEVLFAGRLDVTPFVTTAARQCGLKTVNVKLGIGEEMLPPFSLKTAAGDYDLAAVPDVSLVWGEWQKELIEERFPGYPTEIIVSGRTRNDSFSAPISEAAKTKLRDALDIPEDHKVITYGASFLTKFGMGTDDLAGIVCLSENSYREGLRAIAKVAQTYENMSVIVKPHPVDDLDLLESIAREFAPTVKYLSPRSGYHNQLILSISDIFVSSVSSMFSEALGANCLPVNLWVDDVNYLYEYQRRTLWSNLAYTVDSFDDLSAALEQFLKNPSQRDELIGEYAKNLSRFVGEFDGKNSKRGTLAAFKSFGLHENIPLFNLRMLGYA